MTPFDNKLNKKKWNLIPHSNLHKHFCVISEGPEHGFCTKRTVM